MITHITFASIDAVDLDRAKAFWSDIVGFEVTTDVEMIPGMRWIMLRPCDAETQLQLNKVDAVQDTGMPALPFVAPDVETFVAGLRENEVEIVKEPGPADWDETTTYALFRDSEGNTIMVGSK